MLGSFVNIARGQEEDDPMADIEKELAVLGAADEDQI